VSGTTLLSERKNGRRPRSSLVQGCWSGSAETSGQLRAERQVRHSEACPFPRVPYLLVRRRRSCCTSACSRKSSSSSPV
jgi:hypothetical protein